MLTQRKQIVENENVIKILQIIQQAGLTGFLKHAARAVQVMADIAFIDGIDKAELVNVQVKLDALADEFAKGID